MLWVLHPDGPADDAAPVAALHGIVLVAKPQHEVVQEGGCLRRPEILHARRVRPRVAGQAGCHDVEACAVFVPCQLRDNAEELGDRARPTVYQQQRHGVGSR